MKIEPVGYVMKCTDYTMSIIRATPGEYAPHAVAVFTEAQLRQAMEACAKCVEATPSWDQAIEGVRNLIKEML